MDDELIRCAQARDQAAFRTLVERYNSIAERTARVLLADRLTAEEAVQDAWLDAWHHLSTFECGRPFRPWLLTLVSNRCRMLARRRSLPSIPLDSISVDYLITPSADMAASGTELDTELAAALATLSPDQQRVVALRFFAELELSEIAFITGMRLGTVKSRLHRALNSLRLCFQDHRTTVPSIYPQEETS